MTVGELMGENDLAAKHRDLDALRASLMQRLAGDQSVYALTGGEREELQRLNVPWNTSSLTRASMLQLIGRLEETMLSTQRAIIAENRQQVPAAGDVAKRRRLTADLRELQGFAKEVNSGRRVADANVRAQLVKRIGLLEVELEGLR